MTDELISRTVVLAECQRVSDVAGLVERLKAKRLVFGVGDPNGFQDYVNLDGKEAAATITRLDRDLQAARAEVERLKEALDEIDMRGLQYDAKDLADMARAALKGTSHE